MPDFRRRKSARLRRRPLHGIAAHAEFIVKMRNQLDSWQEWSGIPSFAVRDPDALYLIGMLKVPAAFSLPAAEEVQPAAFVGPDRSSGAGPYSIVLNFSITLIDAMCPQRSSFCWSALA